MRGLMEEMVYRDALDARIDGGKVVEVGQIL